MLFHPLESQGLAGVLGLYFSKFSKHTQLHTEAGIEKYSSPRRQTHI